MKKFQQTDGKTYNQLESAEGRIKNVFPCKDPIIGH